MSARFALAAALLALTPAALSAQATDPTAFASAADIQAQVADMDRAMAPGQGFAWRPVVRDGTNIGALEIWKKPGRPAVHPTDAEYAIVIAGTGTLVSGGTLADAQVTNAHLTEGSRIEGGITRALKPGDVILVPAGTPHWFGITGERLVLLGIKLPASSKP